MLLNLLAYLFLLLSSSHVEFEHEQLCVLKLLILLMEWKMEELSMKSTLSSSREELLIVFPVISLLSYPEKSVKAMVTRLLQILEHFLLDFKDIFEGDGSPCTDFSVKMEAESIPLRLHHYLFTEGQHSLYPFYLSILSSDMVPCMKDKFYRQLSWTSCLRQNLLTIKDAKGALITPLPENNFEGVNILLRSIASSLVIYPTFNTSTLDSLSALWSARP